jgi:GntR family transcriptional regulator
MTDWNDTEPIYQQLRRVVLQRIVTGSLAEGEAVPSVRQVASAEHINPLTVSKAYQLLVDEGLLEARRGLGMFVVDGARATALERERETFLRDEWPFIRSRIQSLGLDVAVLVRGAASQGRNEAGDGPMGED